MKYKYQSIFSYMCIEDDRPIPIHTTKNAEFAL